MRDLEEKAVRTAALTALISYAGQQDPWCLRFRPRFALMEIPGKPRVTRVPRLTIPGDASRMFNHFNRGDLTLRLTALSPSEQVRLRASFQAEQRRHGLRSAKKEEGELQFTVGPTWWDGNETALVRFSYQHVTNVRSDAYGAGSARLGCLFLRKQNGSWGLLKVVSLATAG